MNEEDMKVMIHKYSTMLLHIAFSYLKNTYDAEDVVQNVFLRCYERKMEFSEEEYKKAWLIRAVINESKSMLRSSWFRKNVPIEENLPYMTEESAGILEEVLKLPEKYRTVLVLHYVEGYSITEIAKLLGKNPSTIGTHLDRGRQKLKISIDEGELYAGREIKCSIQRS